MTRAFPTSIRNRPFAVEPTTGTMLPDGIFDASLRLLEITCFYTNDSGRLMSHGFVRLPSKVAPGIRLAKPHWFEFKNLLPGASVRMSFLCDFTEAMASKPEVRFEVGGSYADGTMETGFGFDGYIRKVIWVSKTTYDSVSRQYRCEVPEGALTLLATRSEWSRPFQITSREGVVTTIQLPVPVSFDALVVSGPGFELSLPYSDPWWKVVAFLVFVIATIGSIAEAKNGKGTANIGMDGHGHDNPADYDWCFPDTGGKNEMTPAGIFSVIATVSLAVALRDDVDPWWRGRELAVVAAGEVPGSERLLTDLRLPDRIPAGEAFTAGVAWRYSTTTNLGRPIFLAADETPENTHVVDRWEIKAPKQIPQHATMIVQAKPHLIGGGTMPPDALYGVAVFTSPEPRSQSFRVPLEDDGRNFDVAPNDGWFTAGLQLEELHVKYGNELTYLGVWTVQLFAQDVNQGTPDMAPEVAAQHIGGFPILMPFVVSRISATESGLNVCDVANTIVKVLVTL